MCDVDCSIQSCARAAEERSDMLCLHVGWGKGSIDHAETMNNTNKNLDMSEIKYPIKYDKLHKNT